MGQSRLSGDSGMAASRGKDRGSIMTIIVPCVGTQMLQYRGMFLGLSPDAQASGWFAWLLWISKPRLIVVCLV